MQSAADWHVVAVDPVIEELHGLRFAPAEEAARTAELVARRARGLPAGGAPVISLVLLEALGAWLGPLAVKALALGHDDTPTDEAALAALVVL